MRHGLSHHVSITDWFNPSSTNLTSVVDFTVIEPEELERNCITRGGKAEVKSGERAVQEQREQSTLMVIYYTPSDIPSCPREPPDPFSGDVSTEQPFGDPTEETKVCMFSGRLNNKTF